MSDNTDTLFYTIRSPWAWVMSQAASKGPLKMEEVENPAELPTAKAKAQVTVTATPNTRRRRSFIRKGHPQPCTLRIDILNKDEEIIYAAHGTSAAFDGLEDKDELVRTLQRCRADHLNLSPPSVLIKWDVTRDECKNVVPELPVLPGNEEHETFAVLKEPMGSSGDGIFFVRSSDETYDIVEQHRQRALEDPDFLDKVMEQKGRMPAWVLQAEVYPPLLIHDRRKFHIRTYVAVLEKLFHEDLVDVFVFHRHEVRIAGVPVSDSDPNHRDPAAHITNGSLSVTNERVLLHNVPELTPKQDALELFCAQTFKHLLPDLRRRVGYSASHEDPSPVSIRKFGLAALDIMVTGDGRLYLLEVNVNPSAPPEETVQGEFKEHLVGLMQDLLNVALGRNDTNFIKIEQILKDNGK